jgi:hypothetical protein
MKTNQGGMLPHLNQKILQNIIEEDKKPLPDDQLAGTKKRFILSPEEPLRNTGEQLDIPVARCERRYKIVAFRRLSTIFDLIKDKTTDAQRVLTMG